jgi:hypothetical protein
VLALEGAFASVDTFVGHHVGALDETFAAKPADIFYSG